MSKVFEHSKDFKPENILAKVRGNSAFEKSVVRPTPKKAAPSPPTQVVAKTQTSKPESIAPSLSSPEDDIPEDNGNQPPYEDDFSAPSQQDDNHLTEAPAATIPPEQQEQEPIDVEKIAEESYNKGVQDCLQNMADDFGSSIKSLVSVCEEMNQIRDTILNNSMTEMQDLVLAIAEKIIRQSVLTQDQTIQATVEEAIRSAVKSDEFIILVNPEDLQIIQDKSSELINSLSGLENIVFKPDATITRGGCKVESSNCTVDATIDIQLEVIQDKIRGNI